MKDLKACMFFNGVKELGRITALRVDLSLLKITTVLTGLFLRPKRRGTMCICVEGPGNMGSSALMLAAIQNFPEDTVFIGGPESTQVLDWLGCKPQNFREFRFMYPAFRVRHYRELMTIAFQAATVSEIRIVGADNLDGAYSDLLSGMLWNFAIGLTSASVQVRVMGSSWNSRASAIASRLLKRAANSNVQIYARDTLSCERMASLGGKSVSLVADMAFAIVPKSQGSESSNPAVKKVVICGNPSGRSSRPSLDLSVFETIFRAIDDDCTIHLVPSVVRPGQDDREAISAVDKAFGLHRDLVNHLEIFTPTAFKDFVSDAELVITFRMHPGVLAISEGIPTIFFDYQDKMKGLARDAGIPELCFSESANEAEVLTGVGNVFTNRTIFRGEMTNFLTLLESRARQNFVG